MLRKRPRIQRKRHPLSPQARAFMSRRPALMGVRGSKWYYKSPVYGDEAPLRYIDDLTGKLRTSAHYDLPSAEEAAQRP